MKTRTVVRVRRPFFYIIMIAQQLPYFRFPLFYMGYLNVTNKLKGIQFQAFTLFKNINFTYRSMHTPTQILHLYCCWKYIFYDHDRSARCCVAGKQIEIKNKSYSCMLKFMKILLTLEGKQKKKRKHNVKYIFVVFVCFFSAISTPHHTTINDTG